MRLYSVISVAYNFLGYWCLGHFHDIMQQKIKHDTQLSFRDTHQRSTHPLQAGNIHFITTSPCTARQALMFRGPVEFRLVFKQELWLSEVPSLSVCVKQSLGIRTGCPCLCSFDMNIIQTWPHGHEPLKCPPHDKYCTSSIF